MAVMIIASAVADRLRVPVTVLLLIVGIAIALPVTLDQTGPFPMRSELIFISIAVVLFSLLGQGLSLPWIVRKLSGPTHQNEPKQDGD